MTKKTPHLMNLLLGLTGMIFFLTLSVTATLNARFLYYREIPELAAETGYTEEEIRENYDALIDYNSLLNHSELTFPTLPMSEEAGIHFVEVKRIFVFLEYLCVITGPLFLLGALWQLKKQNFGFLLCTWGLGTAVPLAVGALAASNWDWFFAAFHRLTFDNDYWLFDPNTDPIINLLPDSYFFSCLLILAALMLFLTQLSGALYLYKRKKAATSRPSAPRSESSCGRRTH